MAAAQVPGTQSPAPNAAPASAGVEGGHAGEADATEQDAPEGDSGPALKNLKDFPAKMKAAREAKKAEREGKARPAEAETEQAEARPEPDAITADALFTPEALATPEGIDKARKIMIFAKEDLEKRHRKLDGFDISLKKDKRKLAEQQGRVEQAVRLVQGVQQKFAEKYAIIRGDRVAQPLQICATLDELAGGSGDPEAGRQLLEAMILAVSRDGQAPKETAAEKRLREQYDRLEMERRQEREQLASQQLDGQIAQLTHQTQQIELQIGTTAASNPGHFPAIAERIAAGVTNAAAVGKYVADLIEDAANAGAPLDMAEAIGILESRLAPSGARRASQEENGSGSQQVAASQPRAKSGARKSTVLPSDADRSMGGTRKESPDERRARLARDPEVAKRLGPVFANALRG